MRRLIIFTLLTNAATLAVLFALRLISPTVAALKAIDLLFLTGVLLWLVSSVVRLSTKRMKKEWNRNTMELTDPQLVISTDSLATRFLIAGAVPLATAIVWGFFY